MTVATFPKTEAAGALDPASPYADDYAHYEAARTLVAKARAKQKERGKALKGRNGRDADERKADISAIFTHSALIKTLASPAWDNLIKKTEDAAFLFEKLCARNGFKIPKNLRPYIHRLLMIENAVNAQNLDMNPQKTLSYTIYEGMPEQSLRESFPGLKPGIINQAVLYNPGRAKKAIEALLRGERSVGPYRLANGKIVYSESDETECVIGGDDLSPAP